MLRAAITIKFLGPTNFRGSRYLAKSQAGNLTLSADYALNPSDNARAAGLALASKLGWDGPWHMGGLPDGQWVLVCAAPEVCACPPCHCGGCGCGASTCAACTSCTGVHKTGGLPHSEHR